MYTLSNLTAEQADLIITALQEVPAPLRLTVPLQVALIQQLIDQGHPKTGLPPTT